MDESELEQLCSEAFEMQSDWRSRGVEGRREADKAFDQLLHRIAESTGRSYDEVKYEAVEEWIRDKFCCVGRRRGAPTPHVVGGRQLARPSRSACSGPTDDRRGPVPSCARDRRDQGATVQLGNRAADAFVHVENQLSEERANALGRVGDRLEQAIAAWERLDVGPDGSTEERHLALMAVRDAAYALLVQRDCAGFRHGNLAWIRRHYAIPDAALPRDRGVPSAGHRQAAADRQCLAGDVAGDPLEQRRVGRAGRDRVAGPGRL